MLSDYAIIGLLMISVYWFFTRQVPYRQGFRPSDPSILKPLVLPPTVSFLSIFYWTIMVVPLAMFILESARTGDWYNCTTMVKKYIFGWLLLAILCFFCKGITGRLRPNFLASNRINLNADNYPDWNKFGDHDPIQSTDGTNDRCIHRNPIESRRSFFSGHACLGSYAATNLILYLETYRSTDQLVIPTIQFVAILAGIYPGMSQGREYWHHWSDVIAGYFVGSLFAIYVTILL